MLHIKCSNYSIHVFSPTSLFSTVLGTSSFSWFSHGVLTALCQFSPSQFISNSFDSVKIFSAFRSRWTLILVIFIIRISQCLKLFQLKCSLTSCLCWCSYQYLVFISLCEFFSLSGPNRIVLWIHLMLFDSADVVWHFYNG